MDGWMDGSPVKMQEFYVQTLKFHIATVGMLNLYLH
jgi:hypothetical protein